MKKKLTIVVFAFSGILALSQNPLYFKDEVEELLSMIDMDSLGDETIVFTGSSTIRYWDSLQVAFPDHNLINTSLSGSHMSDLFYWADQLIFRFKPVQVFIYEGDNDVAYGKSVVSIVRDTKNLIQMVQDSLPDCQIVLISAKPSPARWYLKEDYIELNKNFKKISEQYKQVDFINIWDIMLDQNGYPIDAIFENDSLHMNYKGYKLWYQQIKNYLPQ